MQLLKRMWALILHFQVSSQLLNQINLSPSNNFVCICVVPTSLYFIRYIYIYIYLGSFPPTVRFLSLLMFLSVADFLYFEVSND